MKRGAPRHPKTKALARRLEIPIAHAVGILEMLWHFTAEFAPRGDIGRMDDAEIAEAVSWTGPIDALITALVECHWLDPVEEPDRLAVHDWHVHCDDYTKKKIKTAGLVFASLQKILENSRKFTPTLPNPTLPNHAEPTPPPSASAKDARGAVPPELEELAAIWARRGFVLDGHAQRRIWLGCRKVAPNCTGDEVVAAILQKVSDVGGKCRAGLLITTVPSTLLTIRTAKPANGQAQDFSISHECDIGEPLISQNCDISRREQQAKAEAEDFERRFTAWLLQYPGGSREEFVDASIAERAAELGLNQETEGAA